MLAPFFPGVDAARASANGRRGRKIRLRVRQSQVLQTTIEGIGTLRNRAMLGATR